MCPVGFDANGYLRMKGIDNDLSWYKAHQLLKTEVTTNLAVDNQYVDFAVNVLGKR